MTNEEKKYQEALAKAAREYQEYIETNNSQAEAWDFYGAFIAGAIWRDKQSTKEKQALIDKACEWLLANVSKHLHGYYTFHKGLMLEEFQQAMKGGKE